MKSDATLIREVLRGNTAAFDPLVERYQDSVYALVWSVVRDSAAAQDISQDVFITAYARLSELREPARFPAWLRRSALNRARMWLRDHSGREICGDADQVVAPSDGGCGLREEIARALESLPETKREVAILCYVEGLSRKDAARFLDVPAATLRKRLHDAKRLLQRKVVELAERNLEEHLLPRDFANRCTCACKRALEAERKEMMSMATEKENCRCGCFPGARGETKSDSKDKDRPKSKRKRKAAKGKR